MLSQLADRQCPCLLPVRLAAPQVAASLCGAVAIEDSTRVSCCSGSSHRWWCLCCLDVFGALVTSPCVAINSTFKRRRTMRGCCRRHLCDVMKHHSAWSTCYPALCGKTVLFGFPRLCCVCVPGRADISPNAGQYDSTVGPATCSVPHLDPC